MNFLFVSVGEVVCQEEAQTFKKQRTQLPPTLVGFMKTNLVAGNTIFMPAPDIQGRHIQDCLWSLCRLPKHLCYLCCRVRGECMT